MMTKCKLLTKISLYSLLMTILSLKIPNPLKLLKIMQKYEAALNPLRILAKLNETSS